MSLNPVDPEIQEKMDKIQALSDAIIRARVNLHQAPSADNAIELQHLQNQRRELQGLLPKLRLVQ